MDGILCFLFLKALDEMERYHTLNGVVSTLGRDLSLDIALDKYAVQSAALSKENIIDLVLRADINATDQINDLMFVITFYSNLASNVLPKGSVYLLCTREL